MQAAVDRAISTLEIRELRSEMVEVQAALARARAAAAADRQAISMTEVIAIECLCVSLPLAAAADAHCWRVIACDCVSPCRWQPLHGSWPPTSKPPRRRRHARSRRSVQTPRGREGIRSFISSQGRSGRPPYSRPASRQSRSMANL